jgi:gliding motility-associated-like protein
VLTEKVYTSQEDDVITGTTISTEDHDPEGSGLLVSTTPVVAPSHGTIVIHDNGTFTYTPDRNYHGTDKVVVSVCDQESPQACAQKIVNFNLTPLNDGPILIAAISATTEGVSVSGNLSEGDSDPDGSLTYNATPLSGPDHGEIVINADGTYTYTPDEGFVGNEIVVINVCDNGSPALCAEKTLTITVNVSADVAPVAINDALTIFVGDAITLNVTANDTDADGDLDVTSVDLDPATPGVQQSIIIEGKGTASVNTQGVVSFIADAGFSGEVNLNYTVSDEKGLTSNVAQISILIQSNLPEGVFVPNGFSPNGDGQNDLFIIEGAEQFTVSLHVYNRWGNIVYGNKNYKNTWGGASMNVQDPDHATKISIGGNDTNLPDGTYFFVIEFADGTKKRYSGYVELRR